MGMRAHKIKEVSSASTFELRYDALLTDMLEDLGKFEGLNEGGGIMEIKEEDLEEMKEMMKEKAGDYDRKEVEATEKTIAKIKEELDPEWRYVLYYCY